MVAFPFKKKITWRYASMDTDEAHSFSEGHGSERPWENSGYAVSKTELVSKWTSGFILICFVFDICKRISEIKKPKTSSAFSFFFQFYIILFYEQNKSLSCDWWKKMKHTSIRYHVKKQTICCLCNLQTNWEFLPSLFGIFCFRTQQNKIPSASLKPWKKWEKNQREIIFFRRKWITKNSSLVKNFMQWPGPKKIVFFFNIK